jgi:hypothetical protein
MVIQVRVSVRVRVKVRVTYYIELGFIRNLVRG